MAATWMRPVVVGVDGTIASIGAVDLAADEAMARAVPLVVVHAVRPPVDPSRPQYQRLLDLAVSRAAADHPGLAVSAELVRGQPLEALIRRADGGCLLVVGHARSDPGSVAVQVAEHATVPVIVHRWVAPRPGPGRGPVTLGIEDADPDRAVVRFAFEEALLRGAPLSTVHLRPGDGADLDVTRLVAALSRRFPRYAEVPVRGTVHAGQPGAAALATASQDADLIVVGAAVGPARHGTEEHLARTLIDLALCPVAIVADRVCADDP